ncbi:MAG: hypothetical protein JWQ98_3401 [Chlorobi bacterium]|nr:hypothetical protein [Chlorobiota bacterium]
MIRIVSFPLFLLLLLGWPTAVSLSAGQRPSRILQPRSEADSALDLYMNVLGASLHQKARGALAGIPSRPRRLLALKYYLNRTAEEIERKWAWSQAEASAYRSSGEYQDALRELVAVRSYFAMLSPGYRLEAKVEIRSFGAQLGKWNSVGSIGSAGGELITAALTFLADSSLVVTDSSSNRLSRFIGFLHDFEPKQMPTVALPGLSQHGQFRAFDFRVMKGGRVVAGTVARTIPAVWDRAGWTEKLREAICTASRKFDGPLPEPYEPWHYAYHP